MPTVIAMSSLPANAHPGIQAPTATGRRPVHQRRITCNGYLRDDGLWDIEGRLIDTQPQPLMLATGPLAAGEAIHEMLVCLTVDRELLIHDAWARTLHAPYPPCADINPSYRQLIGLRIAPGFTQRVKRMFRATLGCSHLTEMLPPLATTAFQVLWSDRANHGERGGSSPVGGCHALRSDGEIVRLYYPEFHRSTATPLAPEPASQAGTGLEPHNHQS